MWFGGLRRGGIDVKDVPVTMGVLEGFHSELITERVFYGCEEDIDVDGRFYGGL